VPYLIVGGKRVFFQKSGSGNLALFVHGGGLDHTMWRLQLAGLLDVRQCVAIDLPGHGLSEAGPSALPEVIRALGYGRADFVGHSWGGHEVMATWWCEPTVVRSIALFGVMFSADAPPRATPDTALAPRRPVPIEAQEDVIRSIDVPFLVATGTEDTNTPAHLCRKLASFNAEARWLEIPGAGHMSPLEEPDVVNGALRGLW
jgi:pimeloyl-ACP methyl ester carboxylesterase